MEMPGITELRTRRVASGHTCAPVGLPSLTRQKPSIAKITPLLWRVRNAALAAWRYHVCHVWRCHAAVRTCQSSGVIFAIDVFWRVREGRPSGAQVWPLAARRVRSSVIPGISYVEKYLPPLVQS